MAKLQVLFEKPVLAATISYIVNIWLMFWIFMAVFVLNATDDAIVYGGIPWAIGEILSLAITLTVSPKSM